MGSISTKWILAVGLAVCLLPGPALLAEDKEEKKEEEKKEETQAEEKEDEESKSKEKKAEKKKEEKKIEKKGSRGLLVRPTKEKQAQTQTAPSAVQTPASAKPPAPPGTRVVEGFVQQVRKEQNSLIIRDNLTHHQVFFTPDTVIRRGGATITFEQIEFMDKVLECRVNSKKRVLEIRLTPVRKIYAPLQVPNPPPPAEGNPPPSPPKTDD